MNLERTKLDIKETKKNINIMLEIINDDINAIKYNVEIIKILAKSNTKYEIIFQAIRHFNTGRLDTTLYELRVKLYEILNELEPIKEETE